MKILYSPGFGAGWSTWSSGKEAEFLLTYQPIIEFLENNPDKSVPQTLLDQLSDECKERFDLEPYLGGADDLCVDDIPDGTLFKIREYDGSESVEVLNTSEGWFVARLQRRVT